MKYTILNKEELNNVDFTEVLETSQNTLRYNNANTQFLLKFEGDTPEFLVGKTLYDYEGIMQILNSPEWTQPTD
ncbi:MAG: hypothetical protein Unbinned7837contig1000_19 [Prokaryotic dsDNA virus sp.]|nr:MAG: hypothetical protein Unbinned7837contig1000_19 [Prokaryotic dsDNA virus sp.]|tara:strand:- start:16870 stop:17091 length:222 start_codon:yes stop_codon:yes gene_type:complete